MQKLSAEHTASSQDRSKRRAAEDMLPLLAAHAVVALTVVEGRVMVGVEVVGSEVVVRTRDRSLELDPWRDLSFDQKFSVASFNSRKWSELKRSKETPIQ